MRLLVISLAAFCATFAGGLFALRLQNKLHWCWASAPVQSLRLLSSICYPKRLTSRHRFTVSRAYRRGAHWGF